MNQLAKLNNKLEEVKAVLNIAYKTTLGLNDGKIIRGQYALPIQRMSIVQLKVFTKLFEQQVKSNKEGVVALGINEELATEFVKSFSGYAVEDIVSDINLRLRKIKLNSLKVKIENSITELKSLQTKEDKRNAAKSVADNLLDIEI